MLDRKTVKDILSVVWSLSESETNLLDIVLDKYTDQQIDEDYEKIVQELETFIEEKLYKFEEV